jgi:NAD(P)-dependent dehydrogenase (short-subunit alcohol dehydrogenase family)
MIHNSMKDKVVLITGATSGIGRVTALELARSGADVFVACRSLEKAESLTSIVKENNFAGRVEILPLDLSDFESIKACAHIFLQKNLPLHVLINNAGLAGQPGLTRQGFQMTMGVNHIGHFLLTQLLLPVLKQSAPSRIVNVSSRAHFHSTGIDYANIKNPTSSKLGIKEYCDSKLANLLFTKELSVRLKHTGVSSYAVHPGVVSSELWRGIPSLPRGFIKLFMISSERGAKTTIYCATSVRASFESGMYYSLCKAKTPSLIAQNEEAASELWVRSLEWVSSSV